MILAEAERTGAAVYSSWHPTRIVRSANCTLDINVQGNSVAALRRRGLAVKRAGQWWLTDEGAAVLEGQFG